jgi:hypothetical protein
MMRRLFAVWPPESALGSAGVLYIIFQLFCLHQEWISNIPPFRMRDCNEVFLVVAIGMAALYGIYRVLAFHPAVRPGYYEWLCTTPWTSAKTLPLGPIYLVWQDALLLLIIFGLALPRGWFDIFSLQGWLEKERLDASAVFTGFLGAYLFTLGFLLHYTGQKLWGYATLFSFGLMILSFRQPTYFAVNTLLTLLIANIGLYISLAHFPWANAATLQLSMQATKNLTARPGSDPKTLGWPYDRLGPQNLNDSESAWDTKFVMGALLAWWFFVGHYQFRQGGDDTGGYFVLYLFSFTTVVPRLCSYCNGYASPLSLWGRIATGHLIIPGYDQVFVAPLMAVAVAVAAWKLPGWLGVPPLYVTPFALMLVWWIVYAMPPSLKQWRLTGNHRIAPAVMANVQQ